MQTTTTPALNALHFEFKRRVREARQAKANCEAAGWYPLRTLEMLDEEIAALVGLLEHIERTIAPSERGYASAPVAVALLEMRRCLAMIEHETAIARREEGMGGWLYDHTGAIEYWTGLYVTAKAESQGHIAKLCDDAP